MRKPSSCPDEVYAVMIRCWKLDKENRSTFGEIYESLDNMDLGTRGATSTPSVVAAPQQLYGSSLPIPKIIQQKTYYNAT